MVDTDNLIDKIDSISDLLCNIKEAMKSHFYPKSDIDILLNAKSDTNHNHDERYYTESETDGFLNNKSDIGHVHSISEVSLLENALSDKSNIDHNHDERYYTESETDNLLNSKSDSDHIHDNRYYTESEIDSKLSNKSNVNHNHDERYYTESEVDSKLSDKSDINHNHSEIYASLNEFNSLNSKYKKTDAIRVRLIRAYNDLTPYPDNELANEGTQLQVQTGSKLGARLYTNDSTISLANRQVHLIIGSTHKLTTTDSNGITREMIGLNNGSNAIAYAILKGESTFNKSVDVKYVEYV